MAVYEQKYQAWSGTYGPRIARAAAIFTSSFRLTWKIPMVKIFLIFLFIIVSFWIGVLLFIASQPAASRFFVLDNRIYRDGFFNYFVFHQLIMFVTAAVGGGLISRDWKQNAFSIYFSKAIRRTDYLAGKYAVLLSYLALGTLVPVLLLWIAQATSEQSTATFAQHMADLLAIALHSLIIIVPAASVMLMLSSFSKTAYIPAISWILTYEGLEGLSVVFDRFLEGKWAAALSIQKMTTHLGAVFYEDRPLPFGVSPPEPVMDCSPAVPAVVLGLLTAGSLLILSRRLRGFESEK